VPEVTDRPEHAAASGLFRAVIAERYFEAVMRWLEARAEEPAPWQQAAQFGDIFLWLTAGELAELGRQVDDLLDPYVDRLRTPELRPEGARLVSYLRLAFPADGAAGGSAR
jgi:hypothetical protein